MDRSGIHVRQATTEDAGEVARLLPRPQHRRDRHRRLYESMGFTNREGSPDGPSMLFYEREI